MKLFLPALALLMLIGCATPQEVSYDSIKRSPTTSVEFFRDGNKPDRPYKEIGEITYEDFGGEEAHAKRQLITEAKKMGGDAILMLPRHEIGYAWNPFGRSGNKYLWRAAVVVWKPAAP